MKFFLVALAVIAVVSAQQQPPIAIVRQSADIAPDGTYEYSYETENGIHVSARGQPGPVNEEGAAAIVSQGDFGYVGDDGNNYAVRYTADENGYHPEGDHLPVAPPIPEAIARAIEYIRTHPQPPQSQEQLSWPWWQRLRPSLAEISVNFQDPTPRLDRLFHRRHSRPSNRSSSLDHTGGKSSGPVIAILSQTKDSSPDGSYDFSYETENGISVAESGSPKGAPTPEGQSEVVQGRYAYTAPDGTPIVVEYYADETGFHATGAHIPTPPPIPEAIQRAIASLPPSNEGQYQEEGQYNRPPFRRF